MFKVITSSESSEKRLRPPSSRNPLFLKNYKKEDRQTDGQDLPIKSPRRRLKKRGFDKAFIA